MSSGVTTSNRETFLVATGGKDAAELVCPLLSAPGHEAMCIRDRCAMWDGARANCAFRLAAGLPPMVAVKPVTFLTD